MEAPTPHSHDLLLTGELRELPAYTVPEAARYLGLPPATVRAWTYGTTTGKPGKKRRFDPVIQPPAGEGRRLSYFNLAEVFVLRSLRARHKIPLDRIRAALECVRREIGADRPLLHEAFKTDGVRLFVQTLGGSKDAVSGQMALFEAHLDRIEWEGQLAAKLYPFAASGAAPYSTGEEHAIQSRPIVIDIRRSFGRPVVDRIGVPSEEIFQLFTAGDPIERIAECYGCQPSDVEAAIRYETIPASGGHAA